MAPSSLPDLVSTDWLATRTREQTVHILDASLHLPNADRDARREYEAAHVPGAQFLDLASLVDADSSLPNTVPTSRQVLDRLSGLGVSARDPIVLYDDSDLRSSARAWFVLKAHGIANVAILDGGLGKWRRENRPLSSDEPAVEAGGGIVPGSETIAVRSKDDMLANLDTQREQVIDARAAQRVFGEGDDPVHGGATGRIPGSLNLPFTAVFEEDGTYRPPAELAGAFRDAGLDLDQPVVTTCGSGITASVLLFALHLIGKSDIALYDGSWSEWSADPDTPKATGPA